MPRQLELSNNYDVWNDSISPKPIDPNSPGAVQSKLQQDRQYLNVAQQYSNPVIPSDKDIKISKEKFMRMKEYSRKSLPTAPHKVQAKLLGEK